MNNPKVEGTYTSAPERRFVERARHSEKGVNIDEALESIKVYSAGNGIAISNDGVISLDIAVADEEAF